ncbi:MAG: hypothetical protein V1851_01510 [Patescibacteria group bacterium]
MKKDLLVSDKVWFLLLILSLFLVLVVITPRAYSADGIFNNSSKITVNEESRSNSDSDYLKIYFCGDQERITLLLANLPNKFDIENIEFVYRKKMEIFFQERKPGIKFYMTSPDKGDWISGTFIWISKERLESRTICEDQLVEWHAFLERFKKPQIEKVVKRVEVPCKPKQFIPCPCENVPVEYQVKEPVVLKSNYSDKELVLEYPGHIRPVLFYFQDANGILVSLTGSYQLALIDNKTRKEIEDKVILFSNDAHFDPNTCKYRYIKRWGHKGEKQDGPYWTAEETRGNKGFIHLDVKSYDFNLKWQNHLSWNVQFKPSQTFKLSSFFKKKEEIKQDISFSKEEFSKGIIKGKLLGDINGRIIELVSSGGKTLEITPNDDGTFSLKIEPGNYNAEVYFYPDDKMVNIIRRLEIAKEVTF